MRMGMICAICCQSYLQSESHNNHSSKDRKTNTENNGIQINEPGNLQEANSEESTRADTYAKKSTKPIVVVLRCGHVFHQECISQWLYLKDCCPLCRKNQNGKKPITIYLDQEAEAGDQEMGETGHQRYNQQDEQKNNKISIREVLLDEYFSAIEKLKNQIEMEKRKVKEVEESKNKLVLQTSAITNKYKALKMKYNRLVLETNKYKALSRALQESLADKTAQSNDLKQQVDKREEEIQVYKYYKNDLELVRDKVKCLQRKLAAEKKRNLRVEGIQQQVDDSSNNNDNPSPFEVQNPSIHSDTASFSLSSTINPLGKLTKTIYGLNNNDNCNVSDQGPNKVLSANSNSNSNSINPFKLTSTNSPKALRNPARNSASITNNKLKRQLQLSFSPLSKKGKFFL